MAIRALRPKGYLWEASGKPRNTHAPTVGFGQVSIFEPIYTARMATSGCFFQGPSAFPEKSAAYRGCGVETPLIR